MINFYHRLLADFTDLILPITNMLSGLKGTFELIVVGSRFSVSHSRLRLTKQPSSSLPFSKPSSTFLATFTRRRNIQRFNRQRKTALRESENPVNRSDIYRTPKSDLDCSAAELVLSPTLRLPGELFTPTSGGADDSHYNFGPRLRQFVRSLSQVPPRTPPTESYVEEGLVNWAHVFVRCDHVNKPLQPLYKGPFRGLSRDAKISWILRGDKEDVVSASRAKAAVAEKLPDLPRGKNCTDHLPRAPLPSLSHASSFQPFLILLSPTDPTLTLRISLAFAPLVAAVESICPTA
ncbi:hypothetical protein SprV_0200619600 [Sparganum proliferum]